MPLICNRPFSRMGSITRLDLLSHLDGFCLIVSVVKAQALTTHRIEHKKRRAIWPAFFYAGAFASCVAQAAPARSRASPFLPQRPKGVVIPACPPPTGAQPGNLSSPFSLKSDPDLPLCFVGRGFSLPAEAGRDINAAFAFYRAVRKKKAGQMARLFVISPRQFCVLSEHHNLFRSPLLHANRYRICDTRAIPNPRPFGMVKICANWLLPLS